MTKRLDGKLAGLAASELRDIERLHGRRPERERSVTHELAREMAELAGRTGRMVGLVLDRRARVLAVAVGDAVSVDFPAHAVRDIRQGKRLAGIRFVRTKPESVKVSSSDRLLLTRQGLDALVLVNVSRGGEARSVEEGTPLPPGSGEPIEWRRSPATAIPDDFLERISAREEELSRTSERLRATASIDRAILVGLTTGPTARARESLAELAELARSCGILVVDRLLQRRDRPDPATYVGSGFLEEAVHRAAADEVGRLVFDGELTPMQARNVERETGLAVMDRTMLILEIFGRRAVTNDGKLRVELAKLQYLGPHLIGKGIDLSRLGGGKGAGRGAGEMKLEMDRRVLRDNIVRLKRKIAAIAERRAENRKRRRAENVPTVALVGYTNAGKSTLFNALTGSGVFAENLLFATLDTTTRRGRLPGGRECLFIDTVGFIKDLPEGLLDAFRATIDEIGGAHLLLHVVDASHPAAAQQIETVEATLEDLGFGWIPRILLLNKQDAADPQSLARLAEKSGGLPLSARVAEDVRRIEEVVEARLGTLADPPC